MTPETIPNLFVCDVADARRWQRFAITELELHIRGSVIAIGR